MCKVIPRMLQKLQIRYRKVTDIIKIIASYDVYIMSFVYPII